MKKTTRAADIALISAFSLIIFSIGIAILILPPKSLSKNENRPLAAPPIFTFESLLNRKYFEEVGDFYSDHLPLRESFGKIYALSELSLGKREINGIVVCRADLLVARESVSDRKILQANLQAISNLIKSKARAIFFIPPDSIAVYKNELPPLLENAVAKSNVTALPDEEFLCTVTADAQKYYYRTDHHWTSEGAYEAYKLICKRLGLDAYPEKHFTKEILCTDFYGSAYRISALPPTAVHPDSITLYRYSGDSSIEVYDRNEGDRVMGLYHLDALGTGDKYCVFLGGNYAHISIKLQNGQARPKMLIIKDSFANSLVPFLALHYDIEMVDPRYADLSVIDALADKHFDTTLVLCSAQTMQSEQKYAFFINSLIYP